MKQFKDVHEWKDSMNMFFGDHFWRNFDGLFHSPFPQYSLFQNETELICIFCLPGLNDVNQLDVDVLGNTIRIKGNTALSFEGFSAIQEEIRHGAFDRTIELPCPVEEDKIEGVYEDGLLFVKLYRKFPNHDHSHPISIKKVQAPAIPLKK